MKSAANTKPKTKKNNNRKKVEIKKRVRIKQEGVQISV